MWTVHFSGGFIQMAMPQEYGGLGDVLRASLSETGQDHGEKGFANNGTILRMPGELGMYDWQFFPQDLSHFPGLGGDDNVQQMAKEKMLEYYK
jgi:hypothetical protein